MSLNLGIISSSYKAAAPPPSGSLLLDTYPGAAAAYSFRKLRTAYTGSCIRVQSSGSGNPFADIGFLNDVLDTAALLAFVGVNTGRVITWYDQSGNGNNATQSVFADACIIVNAGTLITDGGKVAITGNKALTLNSSIAINSSYAGFCVMSRTNSADTQASFTGSNTPYITLIVSGRVYNSNNVRETQYVPFTVGRIIYTSINISNVLTSYLNNAAQTQADNSYTSTGNITRIMGWTFAQFIGKAQEHIFYNTNQSANRAAINTNLNSFYTIY